MGLVIVCVFPWCGGWGALAGCGMARVWWVWWLFVCSGRYLGGVLCGECVYVRGCVDVYTCSV